MVDRRVTRSAASIPGSPGQDRSRRWSEARSHPEQRRHARRPPGRVATEKS